MSSQKRIQQACDTCCAALAALLAAGVPHAREQSSNGIAIDWDDVPSVYRACAAYTS